MCIPWLQEVENILILKVNQKPILTNLNTKKKQVPRRTSLFYGPPGEIAQFWDGISCNRDSSISSCTSKHVPINLAYASTQGEHKKKLENE